MPTPDNLVDALGWYLRIGAGVAVVFVAVVGRVEPSARAGSLLFRLLILPGATLLWPLVLVRTLRALWRARTPEAHP